MQESNVLESILNEGTILVQQAASGAISIRDFINRYNNFYYYNALDGHEADKSTLELFNKYSAIIELHRMVQVEIINSVFLGNQNDLSQYLEAGRITPVEAERRIVDIAKKMQLL